MVKRSAGANNALNDDHLLNMVCRSVLLVSIEKPMMVGALFWSHQFIKHVTESLYGSLDVFFLDRRIAQND